MKRNQVLLLTCLFSCCLTVLSSFAEDAKSSDNPERTHVFSLTDGSSLVCKPLVKVLPVKTSYAEMEIPLEKVVSATFDKEKKEGTITLVNGDIIKGTISLEKMKVNTLLGDISLQVSDIQEITSKKQQEAPKKIADSPQKRNACINNLRMIDSAKEQAALAQRWADGNAAVISIVVQYLKEDRLPTCPAGGTYDVGVIGQNPKCSVPGHEMPVN